MNEPILLCTVGGAHQPILRAIESTSPRHICFFCTDRDPVSGRPGSITQVTGKGSVIRASPKDDKPKLPNIPTQAGLDAGRFETRVVPADDLDGAYIVMRNAVDELSRQFPNAHFVSDYTGGTKTMTAALVCTALERDDVELQLVAGARSDLVRVKDGTEQAMPVSVARMRLDRAMAPFLGAWSRHAYHEAAEGLDAIRVAVNNPSRAWLQFVRSMSRALARWDNFDHEGALELLNDHDGRVARHFPAMLPTIRLLANGDARANEPACLFDLWLNAERRALQGRYDDAVARWYRLMEGTAQWQLKTALNIDTADFPRDLLPPDADAAPANDGKFKIGLWKAWQVVQHRLPGPAQQFIVEHRSKLLALLELRNHSILAHGYRPVGAEEWRKIDAWTREGFLPLLKVLAGDVGLKRDPQQLPAELPNEMRSEIDGR